MKTDQVNVRYMVDDVDKSIEFYTKYLDFKLGTNAAPGIYCLTKLTIMAILFELNSYALKSFAPIELGLGSIEHAETRI